MAMLVLGRVTRMGRKPQRLVSIQSRHSIRGRNEIYLPIHECLICMVNVDVYTNPMDPMNN